MQELRERDQNCINQNCIINKTKELHEIQIYDTDLKEKSKRCTRPIGHVHLLGKYYVLFKTETIPSENHFYGLALAIGRCGHLYGYTSVVRTDTYALKIEVFDIDNVTVGTNPGKTRIRDVDLGNLYA